MYSYRPTSLLKRKELYMNIICTYDMWNMCNCDLSVLGGGDLYVFLIEGEREREMRRLDNFMRVGVFVCICVCMRACVSCCVCVCFLCFRL